MAPSLPPPPRPLPRPSLRGPAGRTHPLEVLAGMLGRSLGANKALEAVETAARALSFGKRVDQEQALALLEHISKEDGIVGIAARFAKSRVHLHWEKPDLGG